MTSAPGIRGVAQKSIRSEAIELHRSLKWPAARIAEVLDVEEDQVQEWIFGKRRAAGIARERKCENCGEAFYDRQAKAVGQRFCSQRCAGETNSERIRRGYPPREEVIQLYVDEGLTDRDLGRRFGHSYTWALKVRQHYGIPGRRRGSWFRKPLASKQDRTRWTIGLKPEPRCRACGDPAAVLHLHHAVPRSLNPNGKYDLRNGVPLCIRCHLGWHNGQVTLYRDIFRPEEWAFVQTLIGSPWLDRRYPEPKAAA